MLTWYVVQTNPLCERKAVAALKEHGFTAYLPVETKWKRTRKARERTDVPLLTGYLFVGIGPWQSLYHVRQIDGVKGFLQSDGHPAEIRPQFVYELQARQAAGEFDHTPPVKSTYRPGDKVKVLIEGPYKDLIGEVISATEGGRVELMLCAKLNWKTTEDSDHLEAA